MAQKQLAVQGAGKGPQNPSGPSELEIQRSKVRQARAPVICGGKYWKIRKFRERDRTPEEKLHRRERKVFSGLAQY